MVGAIVVCENNIIGEGFTSPYGGPHAEVNAINSVKDQALLERSTLYVTLEPCSHYGKTPPCSDLIISKSIPRVVIGCLDDNPQVAGNGVKKLKSAGCDVRTGVLEAQCKEHHKRFFTFFNKKRPYIVLKWAQSADGFIAPLKRESQKPVWISNLYSRQLVHKWRSEEQAILVGGQTVIDDNPSLTSRDWGGQNPIRVVYSRKLDTNKPYAVFNEESETMVCSEGVKSLLASLYEKQINSILVEGGARTLQAFIDENLWDEARVFYGPISLDTGIEAPDFKFSPSKETLVGSDILKFYHND
jgi:diaminohydroxyphosphoribosylaminopyrimidine deaminase/5-amino-6-(5-phosphoribosylamino)uracil reductase